MSKNKIKVKKARKVLGVKRPAKKTKGAKKHTKPVRLRGKAAKISQEQIDMLLRKGSERGFITSSEILHAIPNLEYDIEGLENIYDLLKERGVELKEAREFLEVKSGKKEKKAKKKENKTTTRNMRKKRKKERKKEKKRKTVNREEKMSEKEKN